MARRTNYSFEKNQKEAKRKKKQAEKLEKKRLAKEAKAGIPAEGETPPTLEIDDDGVPVSEETPAATE